MNTKPITINNRKPKTQPIRPSSHAQKKKTKGRKKKHWMCKLTFHVEKKNRIDHLCGILVTFYIFPGFIKLSDLYRKRSLLPATPETATSTSPRPPGPFMYSLSVLPECPSDKRLPNRDFPAVYDREKRQQQRLFWKLRTFCKKWTEELTLVCFKRF